jgi:hypothetical protein
MALFKVKILLLVPMKRMCYGVEKCSVVVRHPCISTPTNQILRSFKYEHAVTSQLTNHSLEVLQNEHALCSSVYQIVGIHVECLLTPQRVPTLRQWLPPL